MVGGLSLDTRAGKGVLVAAVLGSGMAQLDGTIVNVALRNIGLELDASLAQLQWISNAYLLVLASFILIGGSLGDRFGRRRIFLIGVVWFAVASALCGAAQDPTQLIAARVLQGVGAALLTPGSLAMIQGAFAPGDRARAIGSWSGLGGIAVAIGPFLGGYLVQYASWRWAFLINLPIAVVTVVITHRCVPETRNPEQVRGFDFTGATLGATGLAALTYALVEYESMSGQLVIVSMLFGFAAFAAFIYVEQHSPHAMMPTSMFISRQFSAANGMTLLVYAALGGTLFFLVLELQTVLGYGPLTAGLATLPITVIMLALASRGGELAARIGPRLPMALGPIVCAAGIALLAPLGSGDSYWFGVFPGLVVFSLGLVLLVAPLTATVLAAAPDEHAGIASGVNNAVARAGSLLAVAALPAVVGLSGTAYSDAARFADGYHQAMWISVGLLVAGGIVSGILIENPQRSPGEPAI